MVLSSCSLLFEPQVSGDAGKQDEDASGPIVAIDPAAIPFRIKSIDVDHDGIEELAVFYRDAEECTDMPVTDAGPVMPADGGTVMPADAGPATSDAGPLPVSPQLECMPVQSGAIGIYGVEGSGNDLRLLARIDTKFVPHDLSAGAFHVAVIGSFNDTAMTMLYLRVKYETYMSFEAVGSPPRPIADIPLGGIMRVFYLQSIKEQYVLLSIEAEVWILAPQSSWIDVELRKATKLSNEIYEIVDATVDLPSVRLLHSSGFTTLSNLHTGVTVSSPNVPGLYKSANAVDVDLESRAVLFGSENDIRLWTKSVACPSTSAIVTTKGLAGLYYVNAAKLRTHADVMKVEGSDVVIVSEDTIKVLPDIRIAQDPECNLSTTSTFSRATLVSSSTSTTLVKNDEGSSEIWVLTTEKTIECYQLQIDALYSIIPCM